MSTSRRPSLAEVRATTQTDVLRRRSDEHWAGRLYMRDVSARVTRWVVSTRALDRVTPNALTVLMLLVGLVAAAVLALSPRWSTALVAAVLIQVYLLLDCVDGEVARWRQATSAHGVYLDRLGHHVVESALVVGLGFRAAGGLWERGLGEGGWLRPWEGASAVVQFGASWWMVLGGLAALLVVIGKLESDLVVVARVGAGLKPKVERDPRSANEAIRSLRSLFTVLPLHRAIGAVELSLLVLAAAVTDRLTGGLFATQALLLFVAAIAAMVAVGHALTVLTSRRLR